MIDIATEHCVPFTAATRLVPPGRQGRKASVSTLWRWTMHGRKGIRLETIVIGGTRMTSAQALQRFFDRLTKVAEPQDATSPAISAATSRQREREIEAAEQRLAAAGI